MNDTEAETVRMIFDRFTKTRSATKLAHELIGDGVRTKRGRLFDKGAIYKLLSNRVYLGEAVHKGTAYPGEHQAIISRRLWDRAHEILAVSPRSRARQTSARTPALLKGLIYGPSGRAMSPTHTRRRGRLYRYYVAAELLKGSYDKGPLSRVPAAQVEDAVIGQIRAVVRSPEVVVQTWRALRKQHSELTEQEVAGALERFDEVWVELFPAEQARIVQLLVDRVEITQAGLNIALHADGLQSLAQELLSQANDERDAA